MKHLLPSGVVRVRSRFGWALLLFSSAMGICQSADAADELHTRIDALVQAGAKGAPLSARADDATLVRRIYLDLAGRIPSRQEADDFIASADANKRVKLIDALLGGKEYPHRMCDLFNAMLMERRGDNAEWTKFLLASFAANKPWDQLIREILDPEPQDEALRGAAFFYTRRLEKVGQQETDYPGLTRDVGRLMLGMDLQCAQCHNHLFIDDYKQVDFQGLFTVYQNTFIRSDVKFPAIGEKVMTKKIDFMSVFDKEPLTTGPRVPGGKEIEIPQFEKGQEYATAPDKKINFPGIPKFSPLEVLAHELPTAGNRAFRDNAVNRLWFVMMGRGLVNPLDQQHIGNAPSHPEVLALLAEEFATHKFDIKWLLRELALTDTYQRTTVVPSGEEIPAPETYRVAYEKRVSAEQILASIMIATGSAAETPAAINDKSRTLFVKALANPPQDPEVEFAPSLKSALFVLNDAAVLDQLIPQNGNLVDRLLSATDDGALAEELYQCVLTRKPSELERAAVSDYLLRHQDRRPAAIANLTWSLLACTEFALNH